MNSPLPKNLTASIPDSLIGDAERWWKSLNEDDRNELAHLCDSRREIFLFETFSADDSPKVTGGKFIPHDHAFGIDEWGEGYFQHLLDHPELMIVYDTQLQTFHIGCSRHIHARRCFADGRISHDFQCPFETRDCRMHKILDNRRAIGIRPVQSCK